MGDPANRSGSAYVGFLLHEPVAIALPQMVAKYKPVGTRASIVGSVAGITSGAEAHGSTGLSVPAEAGTYRNW